MSKLIPTLLLLLLLSVAHTKITIISPYQLSLDLENITGQKSVPHTVSDFGFVDYQGSIKAGLLRWPGASPCSRDLLPDEREELQRRIGEVKGKGESLALFFRQDINCGVNQQALIANEFGAKLIIVSAIDGMDPEKVAIPVGIKGRMRWLCRKCQHSSCKYC